MQPGDVLEWKKWEAAKAVAPCGRDCPRRDRAAARRAPTGGQTLVGGCGWNRKRRLVDCGGAMSIARRRWRGEAMTIAGGGEAITIAWAGGAARLGTQ